MKVMMSMYFQIITLRENLKYGLEIIKTRKNLVGVNTHMANRIAQHALENNLIAMS